MFTQVGNVFVVGLIGGWGWCFLFTLEALTSDTHEPPLHSQSSFPLVVVLCQYDFRHNI